MSASPVSARLVSTDTGFALEGSIGVPDLEARVASAEDFEDACRKVPSWCPVTRMPLGLERTPIYRALVEGEVEAYVLLEDASCGEVVLRAIARALYDAEGTVVGAECDWSFAPADWLQRVGVPDDLTIPCACGEWSVTAPSTTPPGWFREALEEHLAECVVLGATRHLAQLA